MAASAVSASTKVAGTSSDSSITLTKPTGTADGDLLLIFCHGDESAAGVADWTVSTFADVFASIKGGATAGASCKLLYKTASGEGASWSVARSGGSGNWGAMAIRLTNAGGNPAIDTYATDTSASNEPVCPTLTTGADECLIVRGTTWNESKTLTNIPADTTQIQWNDLSSNDGNTIYDDTAVATSGSSAGTRTYNISASTQTASFTISIKPPAAPPGGTTYPGYIGGGYF